MQQVAIATAIPTRSDIMENRLSKSNTRSSLIVVLNFYEIDAMRLIKL